MVEISITGFIPLPAIKELFKNSFVGDPKISRGVWLRSQ
jgi:hypothetical protein